MFTVSPRTPINCYIDQPVSEGYNEMTEVENKFCSENVKLT